MASLIGALKVTLGLETAAFETGATRASRRADALGTDMEKLGNRVGTITKVLGAAAIAAVGSQVFQTMSGLVKQGLDYASALGEQAQQLGVTTKELQEYRYAASQAGVEQDVMDRSLAKLTVTIGKAAAGAKGPAAAFEALGVSLRNADGSLLTAGEAFPKIAEGLSKIPDPASRAKIEVELFGKAGQQLDTMLAGGAAEINNLRNAAHQLGIVLSDEQIQKADETADKLAAIKQVLEAKIAGTVADNASSILTLADAFMALVDNAGKAINAYKLWKNELAKRMNENIANGWFTSEAEKAAARARIKALDAEADRLNGKTPPAIYSGGGTAPTKANPALGKPLNLNPAKLRAAADPWSGVSLTKKFGRANFGGEGLGPGSRFEGFGATSWTGGLGEIDQISHGGNRADGGERLRRIAQSIVAGMNSVTVATGEAGASIVRLSSDFGEMGRQAVNNTAQASEGAQAMRTSFEESAQGIIYALDRVAGSFQGGGFLDKLSAFLGLAMQIKGTFFAGGGNGGGGSTGHSSSNRLPGRWSGGPVLAGRAYMVGERGPELFMPGSNGGIVPNNALGAGGARAVNHYHFTGNLMTSEFWAMIQAGDRNAAQAGARGGEARVIRRQSRRVY